MGSSAVRAGRAFVEVGILDRVDQGLATVAGKLNSFGKSVSGMGLKLLGVGVAGATAFAPTVMAASDAVELMNKFGAVFGPLTSKADEWAKSNAKAVNRSTNEIRKSMAMYQAFFVGLGFGQQQALGLSEQITSLAQDLASFHNIADDDAYSRMISALSGSSEVLDQFGINIKQAALEAELLKKGIKWSSASESEKALARVAVIARAMGQQGALGDAAKTSDSFANRLKGMKGAASELSATIGGHLLPPLTQLLDKFTTGIKLADNFAKNHGQLVQAVALGTAGVATFGGGLLSLGMATQIASSGLLGLRTLLGTGLGLRAITGMFSPVTSGLAKTATTAKASRGMLGRVLSAPLLLPSIRLPSIAKAAKSVPKVNPLAAMGQGKSSWLGSLASKAAGGIGGVWRDMHVPNATIKSLGAGRGAIAGLLYPLSSMRNALRITRGGFAEVGTELSKQFPLLGRFGSLMQSASRMSVRGLQATRILPTRQVRNSLGQFTGRSQTSIVPGLAKSALSGSVSLMGSLVSGAGRLSMLLGRGGIGAGMGLLRGGLMAAGVLLSPTGLLIGGTAALTMAIIGANGGVSTLTGGLKGVAAMAGGLRDAAGKSFDSWVSNGTKAIDGISAAIEQGDYSRAWEIGTAAMSASWAATVDSFSAYWAPFVAGFETEWQALQSLWTEGVDGLRSVFGPAVDWLSSKWGEFTSWLGNNDGLSDVSITWADLSAGLQSVIVNTWYGIQDTFESVVGSLRSAWAGMTDFLVNKWFAATGWISKQFIRLKGLIYSDINVEAEIKRIDAETADKQTASTDMTNREKSRATQQRDAAQADIAKRREGVLSEIEKTRERRRAEEQKRIDEMTKEARDKAATEQKKFDDIVANKPNDEQKLAALRDRFGGGQPGSEFMTPRADAARAAGQAIVAKTAEVGTGVKLAQQQFGGGLGKSMDATAKNTGDMVREQKETRKLLENNQPQFA